MWDVPSIGPSAPSLRLRPHILSKAVPVITPARGCIRQPWCCFSECKKATDCYDEINQEFNDNDITILSRPQSRMNSFNERLLQSCHWKKAYIQKNIQNILFKSPVSSYLIYLTREANYHFCYWITTTKIKSFPFHQMIHNAVHMIKDFIVILPHLQSFRQNISLNNRVCDGLNIIMLRR